MEVSELSWPLEFDDYKYLPYFTSAFDLASSLIDSGKFSSYLLLIGEFWIKVQMDLNLNISICF